MREPKELNNISKQIDDILDGKTDLKGEAKKIKLKELFRRLKEQSEKETRTMPEGEVIDT